jgi:geranylgeranyl reductase
MDITQRPIAVVGAGPAGSSLAFLLARGGFPTILFNASGGEKHCGGGIPARTFDEFPWLGELAPPFKEIRLITLVPPDGSSCDLELSRPMRLVSRSSFDEWLRNLARQSGAYLINERVRSVEPDGRDWIIRADTSEHRAEFVVGADGAASFVRRTLSDRFPPSSLSLCAGYYFTPPDENRITIGFLKKRATYAWVFPRPGLASAGIVAALTGSDRRTLLGELRSWLEQSFPGFVFDYSLPYSALVPTYAKSRCPVCGDGWALVGDAAGVAEPVTREGIYFSLKSAELLASSLMNGRPEDYGKLLTGFLDKRHRAALFLKSYILTPSFIERAVKKIKKRTSAKRAMEQYFSVTLRYGILGRWLITSLFR